jgi:hypothetical protein
MRRYTSLLLLGAGMAFAQTPALIATGTADAPVAEVQPAPGAPVQGGSIAEVTYANGLLAVSADNSSLDQILHQIAGQTGMKITGRVSDERVFGRYGPLTPAKVIASLLDGTGSNMLLRETASDAPAELILTPREGGATPPEPTPPENSASGAMPGAPPNWAASPSRNGNPAPALPPDSWQAHQENLQRMQQMQQQQSQQHGVPH